MSTEGKTAINSSISALKVQRDMARYMTVQVYGRRHACDVARLEGKMHVERGGRPSEPLSTDAQLVEVCQQITFQGCNGGVRVSFSDRAQQRPFRFQCTAFEISAQAGSHDDGRTGIGSSPFHCVQQEFFE